MRRVLRLAPWIMLVLLHATRPAQAQDEGAFYPGQTQQRTRRTFRTASQSSSSPVSPYLNLTRTDVPASLNYFTLVRPQVEQDYIKAQLGGLNRPSGQIHTNVPATRRPGQSGHVARFMDYSNFYFRKPGQ